MIRSSDAQALVAIRVAVAALMFAHGAYRVAAGGVAPFGTFLSASHVPMGLAVAWAITAIELTGTLFLAAGRFVAPLSLYFSLQLTLGIALVHWPAGWFVVGGGRNGMEYSVLLITIFLTLAWSTRGRFDRGRS